MKVWFVFVFVTSLHACRSRAIHQIAWKKQPNSIYYFINRNPLAWSDANHECELRSGKLLTIEDAKSQDVARHVIKEEHPTQYWTGLAEDLFQKWSWEGAGVGDTKFTNWAPGQPYGVDLAGCAMMNSDGKWKSSDCEVERKSICQRVDDGAADDAIDEVVPDAVSKKSSNVYFVNTTTQQTTKNVTAYNDIDDSVQNVGSKKSDTMHLTNKTMETESKNISTHDDKPTTEPNATTPTRSSPATYKNSNNTTKLNETNNRDSTSRPILLHSAEYPQPTSQPVLLHSAEYPSTEPTVESASMRNEIALLKEWLHDFRTGVDYSVPTGTITQMKSRTNSKSDQDMIPSMSVSVSGKIRDLKGSENIYTYGGIGKPGICSFPFIHNGDTVFKCLESSINKDQTWCSLTNNYDRDLMWGYCKKDKSDNDTMSSNQTTNARIKILDKLKQPVDEHKKHREKQQQKVEVQRPLNKTEIETLRRELCDTPNGYRIKNNLCNLTRTEEENNNNNNNQAQSVSRVVKNNTSEIDEILGVVLENEGVSQEEESEILGRRTNYGTTRKPTPSGKKRSPATTPSADDKQISSMIEAEKEFMKDVQIVNKSEGDIHKINSRPQVDIHNINRRPQVDIHKINRRPQVDIHKINRRPQVDIHNINSILALKQLIDNSTEIQNDPTEDSYRKHTQLLPKSHNSEQSNHHTVYADETVKTIGGNAGGENCIFPFVYEGRSYFNCIGTDRDMPWCSTTSSYDKIPKWGYCCLEPSCIMQEQALGHTKEGTTQNTNPENSPTEKISTSEVSTTLKQQNIKTTLLHRAGEENLSIHSGLKTYGGNAHGARCVIPFVSDGRTHMKCIPRDDETSWCATTHNYDMLPLWGNCCDDKHCIDKF